MLSVRLSVRLSMTLCIVTKRLILHAAKVSEQVNYCLWRTCTSRKTGKKTDYTDRFTIKHLQLFAPTTDYLYNKCHLEYSWANHLWPNAWAFRHSSV